MAIVEVEVDDEDAGGLRNRVYVNHLDRGFALVAGSQLGCSDAEGARQLPGFGASAPAALANRWAPVGSDIATPTAGAAIRIERGARRSTVGYYCAGRSLSQQVRRALPG